MKKILNQYSLFLSAIQLKHFHPEWYLPEEEAVKLKQNLANWLEQDKRVEVTLLECLHEIHSLHCYFLEKFVRMLLGKHTKRS